MNPDPSILESLLYSTVRIECIYKDGSSGTGTGFFFNFLKQSDGIATPVVVTNNHVIKDSTQGRLIFTELDEVKGVPSTEFVPAVFDGFENLWKSHPDPNVDLCAMPIGLALQQLRQAGKEVAIVPFESNLIYSNADLSAVEDVLMVGYPNGLWDEFNNKPIVRKGITATHPLRDYEGRKEFVIDAACFPGSSGSPVLIYNSGVLSNRGAVIGIGSPSIRLLGVLYAGPLMTVSGKIVVKGIPTIQEGITISELMINLGYVIKAERILELEDLFRVKN